MIIGNFSYDKKADAYTGDILTLSFSFSAVDIKPTGKSGTKEPDYRLTAQTYNEDNGTIWTNAYDAANTANWTWSTSNYDAGGHLISTTTTFDNGTPRVALMLDPGCATTGWTVT